MFCFFFIFKNKAENIKLSNFLRAFLMDFLRGFMQFDASFWSVVKDRIRSINKDNKLIESFVDPIVYVETQGTQELPRLILGVPSTFTSIFCCRESI